MDLNCSSIVQSPFFMEFILNFIYKSRSQSGEAQTPLSVMLWLLPSAAVGPLGFLQSTVNAAAYWGNSRARHASLCWQAGRRCWFYFVFFSQQDLVLHTRPDPKSWFREHSAPFYFCLACKPSYPPTLNKVYGLLSKGR